MEVPLPGFRNEEISKQQHKENERMIDRMLPENKHLNENAFLAVLNDDK